MFHIAPYTEDDSLLHAISKAVIEAFLSFTYHSPPQHWPGHRAAPEFVFLVGIPTMFAASAYAFLELAKDGKLASENWTDVGVAFVAAIITGFVVVKWLLGYIKQHRFTAFAFYRIALGVGLLLWLPAGS